MLIMFGIKAVIAQTNNNISTEVKEKLYRMSRAFDSSYFLAFNVDFIYTALDTVTGKTETSQRSGNYLVKGGAFSYTLGDIEFMQNDSMAFTISHQSKVLFVSKKKLPSAANTLPLKTMVDSLVANYSKYYSITSNSNTASGDSTIKFETLNGSNGLPYKSIEITYDKKSIYPKQVEVKYDEYDEVSNDTIPGIVGIRKKVFRAKTMDIVFSNYKMANIDYSVFKNERYIYFDRMKKQYIPVDQFRDYKLYVNGINLADN